MMKPWLALIPLVLIPVACEQKGPPLTSECRPGTITLTVTILADRAAVKAAGEGFGIDMERGDRLYGFATQVVGTDRHTIYVTPPAGQQDHITIEYWGHELMHAICGSWHP